jgi:microcystin-dependent protein
MKHHYLSILAALTLTTSAFAAVDDYIGAVWATAADFCPIDSLLADGSVLQIRQNQGLYAVLGYRYGGDGVNTFRLPNLNGRTIIGAGIATASTSAVNIAQQVGTEKVTLTQNQLPVHTHAAALTTTTSALNATLKVSATGGSVAPASNTYLSGTATGKVSLTPITSNMYTADTTTLVPVKGVEVNATVGGNVTLASAGSSQPFDNHQPSLGLTYCITTNGQFPINPD